MPVARKLFTILLAMALAAALPAVPGAAVTGMAPDSVQPSQYLGAITLITGDHVSVRRVGERLVPNVLPALGREHIQFATVGTGDELSVVPSDAWAPLNGGRLDRRLFDVAALLRDGYGDAGRADLPLIVQSRGPAALTDAGATVTQTLSSVDAAAVRQPKESTADFWSAHRDAGRIWLDGMRRPSLDSSVPQIGAPTAWRAGYTGRDVTVAVLDTGIDDTHPDLRHRIAGVKNFIPGTDVKDTAGHGTHVAATIAGTGRASNGRYTGVAPDARLLIGKVCEGGCPESAILAGMEWAAAAGAKVVNLSLGGPDTAGDDPLELAVNRLTAQHGTLFVIAAGNDGGYGAETVSSPASADAALAVGAVDSDDALAGFSSRGPRVRDAALKPEIVAPGVEITAARSRFSGLGKKGDRYVALSGTSMATPHVAGAAAILAQQHPDWTGPRLKAALMSSAEPLAGTGTYAQGAGRVDVARAIAQGVHSQPTDVSLGRMAWPHEDDQPVTRTVTYHNLGPAPVTLRLSVTATGPDGEPVPDGMFRLSTEEITVPPGGQSGVDITANTAIPAAEGTFGAHIDAVDGAGLRVTTPVAVDREPESYDLTLRPVDGAGQATDLHFSFLFGIDRARYRPIPGIGGSGTLRVRRGTYHVDATIATPRADGTGFNSSKVAHPTVNVGADTSLVVDARAARPIAVTFDRANVRDRVVAAGYSRFTEHSALSTGVLGDTFDRILIGQIGDPLARNEMVADIGGMWAVPDAQGDVTRSTVTYNLQWFDYGRLPNGLTRHIVDADLAQVHTRYREQADRKRATKLWIVREPELGIGVGFGFGFRLPLDRTEFHNLDGLQWSAEFQQWEFVKKLVHFETVLTGGVVDHQPGQSYVEDWNSAVFGPGFTRNNEWASRSGDQFLLNIPMYSDAGLDRAGQSELDSGTTALYLGDTKLGETNRPGSGQFDVPAELSGYRLETTANRGRGTDVSDFSTRISCVWTFTSVRPPDPDPGPKTAEKERTRGPGGWAGWPRGSDPSDTMGRVQLPVMPPVLPMLAKPVGTIPPDRLYEPKWDGFRSIIFRDGDEVEIGSRNERPMTRYFPEVVVAVKENLPPRCVVDGEIILASPETGRLEFNLLSQRIHPAASRVNMLAEKTPAMFVAFDLLAIDDADLTQRPFAERRAALEEALKDAKPPVHVTPATRDIEVARQWFELFEGAGLDGLIAKPLDGVYEPDKRVLAKVKHERTADCVVAGYRVHKKGPGLIGSLMLGLYTDEGTLASVGVVGAFPMARRKELFEELQPLITDLTDHPWNWAREWGDAGTSRQWEGNRWNAGKDMSFVPLRPERVVEVRYDYMEGTRFRHTAQFVRWRPDREPRSCTYDQLEQPVRFNLADVLTGGVTEVP